MSINSGCKLPITLNHGLDTKRLKFGQSTLFLPCTTTEAIWDCWNLMDAENYNKKGYELGWVADREQSQTKGFISS